MRDEPGIPRTEVPPCPSCDSWLMPMTYERLGTDDARVVDNRPPLKCPGCGRRFYWNADAALVEMPTTSNKGLPPT